MTPFVPRTTHRVRVARRQIVAVLLALALGGHQFVMASPLHAHIVASGVFAAVEAPAPHRHAQPMHDATDGDTGGDTEPHHLAPCPVEEARLVALLALPPLALAVVAVLASPLLRLGAVVADARWLWPPDHRRRRALLQLFLC